jgi:lantibiotic modifying enzyme
MNDPLRAAHDIARQLVDEAIWWRGRCSWLAPEQDEERGRWTAVPLDGSLYSGTAGVGLFLAEVHVATGDPAARRTALGAIRHALDNAPAAGPGLYEGAVGIAWAAARCAASLGESGLAERAADAAAVPTRLPSDSAALHDLVSGDAGALLGLLALDADCGANTAAAAASLAHRLVTAAREHPDGSLSWPPPGGWVTTGDLLGMAHGAAGIAMALIDAGSALGREDLMEAGLQGVAYERRWLDATGDWPDLRGETANTDEGPLNTLVAWCHGAAGIALGRLCGWQRTLRPDLLEEAVRALDETARAVRRLLPVDGADFCLCHGLAGNASVLLDGGRLLGAQGESWVALAREVAEAGADRYPCAGRPWPCGPGGCIVPGLMTGVAGIGWFLLRLDRATTAPVLAIRPDMAAAPARPRNDPHATRERRSRSDDNLHRSEAVAPGMP